MSCTRPSLLSHEPLDQFDWRLSGVQILTQGGEFKQKDRRNEQRLAVPRMWRDATALPGQS